MRIFYFSGTGNSLYAAKRIAGGRVENELTSISERLRSGEQTVVDREVVVVSPVYFYSLPPAVVRFINDAQFSEVDYLSVVLTAEFPNGLALGQVVELFRRKGLTPQSLYYTRMPTNYLIKSTTLSAAAIDKQLSAADRKLDRIAETISARRSSREHDSWVYSLITGASSAKQQWESDFPRFDSGFRSTDSCNGCRTCETNCPSGNITVASRPEWHAHCEACLRCINICPKHAIQYGDSTEGRRRYVNPRVSIKELR